jgi:hypothetical protein
MPSPEAGDIDEAEDPIADVREDIRSRVAGEKASGQP